MGKSLLFAVFACSLVWGQSDVPPNVTPFFSEPQEVAVAPTGEPASASSADDSETEQAVAEEAFVSLAPFVEPIVAVARSKQTLSQRCWAHEAGKDECGAHWLAAISQSIEYVSFLAGTALLKDKSMRQMTFDDIEQGVFIQRWINSASNYWYSHWDQDSPWKDTYIGHPFMGAISQAIWVQNDPYGATLTWENSSRYWKSRLRALPLTVATSFEWKLGPIGEASFGNSGYGANKGIYFEPRYHKYGNDTGLGPLVTTPVGGFLWFWGEDMADRHLMPKLEGKSHNPFYLFAISFVTPAHGFANLLRFKAPWYRDGRDVKAHW